MAREEWRPVIGYAERYEVSGLGSVAILNDTTWNYIKAAEIARVS